MLGLGSTWLAVQETIYRAKSTSYCPRRSCQTRRVPTRAPHSCRQQQGLLLPELEQHLRFARTCPLIASQFNLRHFAKFPARLDIFPRPSPPQRSSAFSIIHTPRKFLFSPDTPRVPATGRSATPHFAPRNHPVCLSARIRWGARTPLLPIHILPFTTSQQWRTLPARGRRSSRRRER